MLQCRAVDAGPRMRVERADPDSPEARSLLEGYFRELAQRLAPDPVQVGSWWSEDFRSPAGAVLLAFDGPTAVGCAGLRPFGEATLELKHFFLRPEVRGRGLGRVMLAGVEQAARALGARKLVLDTAAPLREAAALYLSAGYERIPRYNDNPHAAVWFGRDL